MPDIKDYVARVRAAAAEQGLDISGKSVAELAQGGLEAFDPQAIIKEKDAPSRRSQVMRQLGVKPDFTKADLDSQMGGSTLWKALREGADPTGFYDPLYKPEDEASATRIMGGLAGAVGSNVALAFTTGGLGNIASWLGKANKARKLAQGLQAAAKYKKTLAGVNLGWDALQAQSAQTNEEESLGYTGKLQEKAGLVGAGTVAHLLRMAGPLGQAAGTAIDIGSQMLPSHALQEAFPKRSMPGRYASLVRSGVTGEELDESGNPTGEQIPDSARKAVVGGMVGLPAAMLLGPVAARPVLSKIRAMRAARAVPSHEPTVGTVPPTGGAEPSPQEIAPTEYQRTFTGEVPSTKEAATATAKSSDLYNVKELLGKIENPESRPLTDAYIINGDGSHTPILGYRGADRMIIGDGNMHESRQIVRAQKTGRILDIAGKKHPVELGEGFDFGPNPMHSEPTGFKNKTDGQIYLVVGHNPDTKEFMVYDPRTGKQYFAPADRLPGIEDALKPPPPKRSEADVAAENLAKGKAKDAYREQQRFAPAQPHQPTGWEDIDKAIAGLYDRLGRPRPQYDFNKFGG